MAIVINGSGTVTGISVGGLPDDIVDSGTLADNSVDSDHYVDGSIDNAHLADDAVDSDELAAGAIDAAHLASGVGGSLVKLLTQTASSSSNIAFSSTYITSTYKSYQLHWQDVVISSDGGNISGQVSPDNGSTMVSSSVYNYWRHYSNSSTSNNTILSSGTSSNTNMLMCGTGTGIGTATDENGAGWMILINPFGTDFKHIITDSMYVNSGGNVNQNKIYTTIKDAATYNYLKISPNTGTIVSGTFTLYGVAS